MIVCCFGCLYGFMWVCLYAFLFNVICGCCTALLLTDVQSDTTVMVKDRLINKGLRIAHLNVCSLKNKVQDILETLINNNLHILAISETHLDTNMDRYKFVIAYKQVQSV